MEMDSLMKKRSKVLASVSKVQLSVDSRSVDGVDDCRVYPEK